MLRFALLLMLFAAPLFGQSTPANCPTISVSGPAGIVPSGQTALFTANFRSADPSLVPQFRWEVTGGELVGGQGSRNIQVRFLRKTVIVTVEILGLPPGCPNTASEAIPYCEPNTPVKLGFSLTADAAAIKNEVDRVKAERKAFPYDQIYILIGIQNGWTESDAESVEKRVIDALAGPSGRELIHDARVTMVRCGNKDLPVTIWRVPPGAENPDCNSGITYVSQLGAKPIEPECPEITVTGPAGVMKPGQDLIFTANTAYSRRDELVFRWMTTGGRIVQGQGTQSITVATSDADHWTNITALLSVIGLDRSCKATAEETARVEGGGSPITLSEFGPLSADKLRLLLDRLVPTFKEHADSVLFIVVNPAANETTKQIEGYEKLVRNHLETKHRISNSQIVFAKSDPKQARSTKIYLVPSYNFRPTECPTISVIGPPGVIEPGESIEFSAKLDGELPTDLILTWSTSQGEILSGQGTTNVKVSTDPKFAGTTTTVTLNLSNLPPGCPSAASESMPLIWEYEAILLEELVGEVWKNPAFPDPELLKPFRGEPSATLVIIGYFPPGTFQSRKDDARVKIIERIASKRIVEKLQIAFVDGGEDPFGVLRFRFYKVPQGAARPNP